MGMNLSNLKAATEKELKTMSGIIYLIYNKSEKKGYVGQTYKTFWRRYINGKWWEYTRNPILKNVNLSKIQDYEIYILESGKSTSELNVLEPFYIGALKTLHPNGYNFQLGGESKGTPLPSTKEILSQKNSKEYILYKNGKAICVKNIKAFCDSLDICATAMFNMIHGRSLSCAGYTINPSITAEPYKKNFFTLEHPEYGEKTTECLSAFARENNIPRGSINGLATGHVETCHGWKIIKEKSHFSVNSNLEKGRKYSKIILKHLASGNEYTFVSVSDAAKAIGKHKTTVASWLSGRYKLVQGWEIVSTTKSDTTSGKS